MRPSLSHTLTSAHRQAPAPASRARRAGLLATVLLACLLIVSACSSGHTPPVKTRKPAGVDPALRAAGQLQLETFQQWIGLLQQFNGQISPYGQELLSARHQMDTA